MLRKLDLYVYVLSYQKVRTYTSLVKDGVAAVTAAVSVTLERASLCSLSNSSSLFSLCLSPWSPILHSSQRQHKMHIKRQQQKVYQVQRVETQQLT